MKAKMLLPHMAVPAQLIPSTCPKEPRGWAHARQAAAARDAALRHGVGAYDMDAVYQAVCTLAATPTLYPNVELRQDSPKHDKQVVGADGAGLLRLHREGFREP